MRVCAALYKFQSVVCSDHGPSDKRKSGLFEFKVIVSALYVCSLIASAPAFLAAPIILSAFCILPPWLPDISATMNVGCPGPIVVFPILQFIFLHYLISIINL